MFALTFATAPWVLAIPVGYGVFDLGVYGFTGTSFTDRLGAGIDNLK